MDIIEEIITKTERKIESELDKVNKAIDFNPWSESIEITDALKAYINTPNASDEEYEAIKKRQEKNKRDIKKVDKPDYLDKLFEKQNDLESQKRRIARLKMML